MKKQTVEETLTLFQKKKNKLISMKELKENIVSTIWTEHNEGKIYKITHQLKNRGLLISIKKDILYIKNPKEEISHETLEEQFYRKILKQHCEQYCKQDRYLWELTALEINMHGTGISIPEEVIIFNKKKQAIETVMFEKKVNFKTYESKGRNLYTPLSKQTKKIRLKWGMIRYANLELSILECLYNTNIINKGYIEGLISQAIKKHHKSINPTHFESILKQGKHNSSANRFLTLIKSTHPILADQLKKLIKKYGYLL